MLRIWNHAGALRLLTAAWAAAALAVLLLAPASAGEGKWTKYQSPTVNLSKRQTYFVNLDFSLNVAPGWTVVEGETTPASAEAQHGSMEVKVLAPSDDGKDGSPDLAIIRIRALPLDVAVTKSWLSHADQDLDRILPKREQVSRSILPAGLMRTPYIMSKPGLEGYSSSEVVETVYNAVDSKGSTVKVKAYTLWCLNIVANVIYIAAPESFEEHAKDFEAMAASFWMQMAHPYKL